MPTSLIKSQEFITKIKPTILIKVHIIIFKYGINKNYSSSNFDFNLIKLLLGELIKKFTKLHTHTLSIFFANIKFLFFF